MRRSSEDLFTASAADIKVGSFLLRRPVGEEFIGGIGDTVYQVLSGVPPRRGELENYLRLRARAGVTDSDLPAFRDFLLRRADGAGERLLLAGTDYLNSYLNGYVADEARGLGFVNNVEIDFQTPLGNRRGSGGLSALGALRETNRDAIVWQLRGYVAEQDGKGANAGLIYRRAARVGGDALLGGNVFVDFEKHGESGETFLRWSLGGEYRNAYLDFTANRYFAISDAVVVGDEVYYTAEGIDAELNVSLLKRSVGSLSGGLGYYNWEGIRGDKDDEGLRYHLRFLPGGGNLHLELQFDVPEEGDEEWGGRVAYRHVINAAKRGGGGNLGGAERDFDARGHFFDAARREYAQRIRRLEDGGGNTLVQASAIAGIAQIRIPPTAQPLELNAAAANSVTVFTRPLTIGIGTHAAAELALAQTNAWTATVGEDSELVLYLENDGSSIFLDSGQMLLTRRSSANNLNTVAINGPNTVTIGLYGTQCYFSRDGNARRVVCNEGEVRVAQADNLALRYGGSSVTIVIGTTALHCNSAESRFRHRALDETFPGCFGDVQVNMPAEGGNAVIAVSYGETVTIERSGTPVSTIIKGRTYTLTVAGSGNIPLDRDNVTLMTPAGNGEMVTVLYPTANISPSLTAALAALAPQTAPYMLGGGSEVRLVNDRFFAVDNDENCNSNEAPLAGVDNALRACGDVSFASGITSPYRFGGRTNQPKRITLTLSGGSGKYKTSLNSRGHSRTELRTVAAVPPVAGVVVLSLNAVAERAGDEYVLRVSDADERFAGVVRAAELTINVVVNSLFAGVSQGQPPVIRTLLDDDIAIATISFDGAVGDIEYVSAEFSDNDAANDYDGDSHFKVDSTAVGNGRIVVSLTVAIAASVDIEIAVIARDDEDGVDDDETATVTVTIQARDPGALVADDIDYGAATKNSSGHYEFLRVGQDLVTIVGVTNRALPGGVMLSGLGAGESYSYTATPADYVVVTVAEDGDGRRGILRFADPDNPPAAVAAQEVEVVIKDRHGAADGSTGTPHLTLTLSIALVNAPFEVEFEVEVAGEVQSLGDRLLADDEVLFTVAVSGGSGGYTRMVNSDEISADINAAGEVRVNGAAAFFSGNTAVFTASVEDSDGDTAGVTVSLGFSGGVAIPAQVADLPAPAAAISANATLVTLSSGNPADEYRLVAFSPAMQSFMPAVSSSIYVGLTVLSDGSGARLVEAEWVPEAQTITVGVEIKRADVATATVSVGLVWADAPVEPVDADKDILLLGNVGAGGDDIWVYDNSAANWTLVTNVSPVGLLFHGPFGLVGSNNTLYLFGGDSLANSYTGVRSSADGKDWNNVSGSGFGVGQGSAGAFHEGSLYFMGGRRGQTSANTALQNDVWVAAGDGSGWTERTDGVASADRFQARWFHSVVSHRGSLYVVGGRAATSDGARYGDVWVSADGGSWEQLLQTAPFGARSRHAAVSFGGKIYVIGGRDNNNFASSTIDSGVWSSVDGKRWRLETNRIHSSIDKIYDHSVIVRGNRMLLIGGTKRSGSGDVRDHLIYASSDGGKTWAVDNDLSNANIGNIPEPVIFLFDRPAP